MATQQHRSKPSIILTLKVLQLVHQLRRRLKHRSQSSIFSSEARLGLESKVLGKLAKGLPHRGLQNRKHSNHASDRVCKNWNHACARTRPRLKLQTTAKGGSAIQNRFGGEEVQHILHSVDETFGQAGSALSAVAGDHELFLQQKSFMEFRGCSLNDITQALVLVYEAINVICASRSQFDDKWLIALGQDVGLNFDEAFIANYEHLLFQLQTELINALRRKVLEALLLGDHDKKQHRLLVWFTEFADKPRALSTFPWTIKPSLAVLWGVCWMFYNSPNSHRNTQRNNSRVPQDALLSNVELVGWDVPQSNDYFNFGLGLVRESPLPEPQQQLQGNQNTVLGREDGDVLRSRNAEAWVPIDLEFDSQPGQDAASRAVTDTQTLGHANGQGFGLSTTYCSPFPAGLNINDPQLNQLLPNSATSLQVLTQQFGTNLNQSWLNNNNIPHNSLPQETTNHLTSSFPPPSIYITGSADTSEVGFAAPQDFASLNNNLYPASSRQPQALSPLDTSSFTYINSAMGNCQPLDTPIPHDIKTAHHERTSSINSIISNSNFPTPVSMAGGHSPLLSPTDRRPSVAHSVGYSRSHSRQPSVDGSVSQFGDDSDSPGRKNHVYKRSEEPPRNTEGKMVCKHDECTGVTFDRKCEWSKHMDKHDRPYKCNVKGCEKLQGFTYSGGLLRHEREVHKMHGGTKKSLFCPFADCKRSSGSGFTRKENLAEHIRRVHRRTSMSADLGHLIISRSDSIFSSRLGESRMPSEPPFSRILEHPAEERESSPMSVGMKRKRNSESALPELSEESDLRAEIKRLRQENDEKDSRLHQLEAAVMALQQARR